jgi:hypothetical protein
MEYLMTYGWAILIIAVVLAALFGLNIFNSGQLVGSSCIAATGYLCKSLTFIVSGTSDVLSFTFGQNTGDTVYNVGLGCAAGIGTQGLPNPSSSITLLDAGLGTGMVASAQSASSSGNIGAISSGSGYNTLALTNGQTVTVTGMTCYDSTGAPFTATSAPLGTAFTGSIWMNYTSTRFGTGALSYNGLAGGFQDVPSGNWLTIKVATVATKVV